MSHYHEERTYRRWIESDLLPFQVTIGESDLHISAERLLPEVAEQALSQAREELEEYLARDPKFGTALLPHSVLPQAPPMVTTMADAARACGVGPMAAVAGAVAEYVGNTLLSESSQVIVENGGDIFLCTTRPRTAAIYAGNSPLTGRLGIHLTRLNEPLGLCTSSGTVGPSLSFGRADAAIILASSAALADAAATALGNRIQTADDIERALGFVRHVPGVLGAVAIVGESLGAWGEIELVRVDAF